MRVQQHALCTERHYIFPDRPHCALCGEPWPCLAVLAYGPS